MQKENLVFSCLLLGLQTPGAWQESDGNVGPHPHPQEVPETASGWCDWTSFSWLCSFFFPSVFWPAVAYSPLKGCVGKIGAVVLLLLAPSMKHLWQERRQAELWRWLCPGFVLALCSNGSWVAGRMTNLSCLAAQISVERTLYRVPLASGSHPGKCSPWSVWSVCPWP